MSYAASRAPGAPGTSSTRRDEIIGVAARLFAESGYTRTSLRDIADAAGILVGSLYHHFDSKEALAAELVQAFHRELDQAARTFGATTPSTAAIARFGRVIAELSGRHRAALQLCTYAAPSVASPVLTDLVRHEPPSLDRRWRALLGGAIAAGEVGVSAADGRMVRVLLRRSTLRVGTLPLPAPIAPADVADIFTGIVLDGFAVKSPPAADLDASAASAAVDRTVVEWESADRSRTADRRQELLDAARSEFAHRGFEATTVRDIAAAAGARVSSLYRYFESKNAMLHELIDVFSGRLVRGFAAVEGSDSSPVQRLDALIWLMIEAGRRYHDELAIMTAWWRLLTPASVDVAFEENQYRLRLLRETIEAGVADGSFRTLGDPGTVTACVRELMWMPMRELGRVSTRRIRDVMRAAVLGGVRAHR